MIQPSAVCMTCKLTRQSVQVVHMLGYGHAWVHPGVADRDAEEIRIDLVSDLVGSADMIDRSV